MAGRLLLIILMCSVHEIQPQALRQPKLTAYPSVITQKDAVTLNCEAPSSVPVPQCYFNTLSGKSLKNLTCLTTLTATELLKMSHQSSTSVVEVICYYRAKFGENNYVSPYSDTTSVTIHILHPPKLTVNPAVITETDSVTLNCQTPSSVSVSQCFIYTGRQENIKGFSCLRTLKGADLLSKTRQSSPAVIEVKCYYTEELNFPSPHSETSSITVHSPKPKMSVQHFHGDRILFTCTLPKSVYHETTCNLYFGEADRPVKTTNIWWKTNTKTKTSFCQFTVTVDDFLSRLHSVQQSVASCDYSLGSETNSLSPRSDGYSLTDIVEKESHMTHEMLTFTVTTGLTDSRSDASVKPTSDIVESESSVVPTQSPFKMTSESRMTQTKSTVIMSTDLTVGRFSSSTAETTAKQPSGLTVSRTSKTDGFISTSLTPVKPTSVGQILDGCSTRPSLLPPLDKASKTVIWKLIVGVVGFGVSLGVLLLILVLLSSKRRTETRSQKRTQAIVTDDSMCMRNLNHTQLSPAGNDEAYSLITSVPGADCPTDSEKLKRQEYHNEDSDIYHVYSTIPEEPPLSVSKDMVYSTVQAH